MPGRQMEGDNRQRRKRAREAREHGKEPSEAGATLGSSKQRRSLDEDYPESLESKHGRKAEGGGVQREERQPTEYDSTD